MTILDASSELHHRLRQATKCPHRALDHHPLLAPLVRQDLTVDQYGQALAALHGVHAATEADILSFLKAHPGLFDYHTRRKLPALESDLAMLGYKPVPPVSAFPVPQTLGALIGVLYTIEGSAQGGQVIARLLRQLPQMNLPIAFFDGYGNLSQQRWEEFLLFADINCVEEQQDIAVETAVLTFEAIKTHLDACFEQIPRLSP